eukprot:TRINITY_DN3256_c0_g1_i1.p2 TRINITY_DN3256_c0_g1~~TRINITY_DN3256_c0_g1_i1.p2  ORF type:complete len:248 (+),score=65.16 TRINITY_DN3256_c0_g1_i1:34-777(+)
MLYTAPSINRNPSASVSAGTSNLKVAPSSKAFNIKGGISNVSTFLGRRPPPEIRQLLDILPNTSKPVFRSIIKFVLEYLKGTEITEEHWLKLIPESENASEYEEKMSNARLLFAGLLTILRVAIRERVTEEVFKEDLAALQIQPEFISDLNSVLKKSQADEAMQQKHVTFPRLLSVDWRVDVTISTSEMQRVLKPTILMRTLDDSGNIKTFEMNSEQFNKLRYSVARVLKEFDTIEKLQILKIDKQQ